MRVAHLLGLGPTVRRRLAAVVTLSPVQETVPRLRKRWPTDGPRLIPPLRGGTGPTWTVLSEPPLEVESPEPRGDGPTALPAVGSLTAFTAEHVHAPVASHPQCRRCHAQHQRHRRREVEQPPPHAGILPRRGTTGTRRNDGDANSVPI